MSNDTFGDDPRLPEDIREIFIQLCEDVYSLNTKWNFYLQLFSSEENTELLSHVAQGFFQTIEESLRHDIAVGISRLRDRRKGTLSLKALIRRCGAVGNLCHLLKIFEDASEPVWQYRNKRVGHSDLNTIIKPYDNPLPGIGRSDIDRIVQLATTILTVVYRHFTNRDISFKPYFVGGADDLLDWLKIAKERVAEE